MLSSISPLGERARQQRFWITAASYAVASAFAGAALGSGLGILGALVGVEFGVVEAWILASLALAGIVIDSGWRGLRVPGVRRQVDEDWLVRYRGWVYGAGYGAQLGVGFATVVATMSTWLVFVCAGLAGPIGGCVIGATFGIVRALPLWSTVRIRNWDGLRRFMATMQTRARLARRSVVVAQLASAVGFVGLAAA